MPSKMNPDDTKIIRDIAERHSWTQRVRIEATTLDDCPQYPGIELPADRINWRQIRSLTLPDGHCWLDLSVHTGRTKNDPTIFLMCHFVGGRLANIYDDWPTGNMLWPKRGGVR